MGTNAVRNKENQKKSEKENTQLPKILFSFGIKSNVNLLQKHDTEQQQQSGMSKTYIRNAIVLSFTGWHKWRGHKRYFLGQLWFSTVLTHPSLPSSRIVFEIFSSPLTAR